MDNIIQFPKPLTITQQPTIRAVGRIDTHPFWYSVEIRNGESVKVLDRFWTKAEAEQLVRDYQQSSLVERTKQLSAKCQADAKKHGVAIKDYSGGFNCDF